MTSRLRSHDTVCMIDLSIDRILMDEPIIDFDPSPCTDEEILKFLEWTEAQLFMLYDDGHLSTFFWEACREKSLCCRAFFSMVIPIFSSYRNQLVVAAYIKFLNKTLKLAVECELALDTSGLEFEKTCNACMCDHDCPEIKMATEWLNDHEAYTLGKFFEEVAVLYTKSHPGHFRPFMMAWYEINGGI
jgi:hypothetical protein